METVTLTALDAATAAQMLAGVDSLDPRGIATPESVARMCEHGQPFAVTHHSGAQAVYVIAVENGIAWVSACKGISGPLDLTATLAPIISQQAAGMRAVGFQTARPGLVRKAQRHGYRVTGWILHKGLSHA